MTTDNLASGHCCDAGSVRSTAFEAYNPVSVSVLPPILDGRWDDTLSPRSARVDIRRFPSGAPDGLELETLSGLDLAFFAGQQLGQDTEVTWSLGPDA